MIKVGLVMKYILKEMICFKVKLEYKMKYGIELNLFSNIVLEIMILMKNIHLYKIIVNLNKLYCKLKC
jgi:hypothetical protein